jgi:hypothetical protein
MEPMSAVIGIIGTLLLAIGGYLVSFGHQKGASIWFFFAGSVLLLLSGALLLHGKLWVEENLLLPANDPTPEILPGVPTNIRGNCDVPAGDALVFLGPLATSTNVQSFVVLRLYGEDLLKISKSGPGISIFAKIQARDSKIVAILENNRFRVNPNSTFSVSRNDPSTLEVVDNFNDRVLYVRFMNPTTIRVEGIFRSSGRFPVNVDSGHIIFGPLALGPTKALHLAGTALLEWPSDNPAEYSNFDTITAADVVAPVIRCESRNGIFSGVAILNGKRLAMTRLGGIGAVGTSMLSGAISFRDPESTAPLPDFEVPKLGSK